jgi:hypothetical protein
MALVRMFHYSCDGFESHNYPGAFECDGDTGDSWYASEAKDVAIKAGWHINAKHAICGECWDNGVRFKDLS